jgi:BASS family bile acid:Na+ symporter
MEIVTTIAPFALALIMFGLGLGLSTTDFSRVIKNPKDFFVGLVSQLILLPIVALGLVFLLNLPTTIAVGLMIIAAAPGGVTSNILTKFANGDVALSVTLTAVTSLVCILSVPFVVINSANIIGVSISSDISIAKVALKMALVVTVPVLFGMIIRKMFSNFILSKINLIDKLSGILFVIVFTAIYIEERNNILAYILQAGLAVLILNIVMMTLAFLIAKKFTSGISQQKCIAIEGGLQNGTVAVFVATLIFDDVAFIIPTAAYALIQYLTGFLFIALLRKSN